jgi:mono/diheme cytochrome c family protein
MSSDLRENAVEDVPPDTLNRLDSLIPKRESVVPEVGSAPIPVWLVTVIGLGLFWAGAYLFSFSGGFRSDVFDFEPKFGVVGGGAGASPDPKVVGKALFSANCITCHQANGEGLPGQYPPLAGSEIVLGPAVNHTIAIVLKGLQGPVTVKGQAFNNAMQPWEGQYTDQQLAAILTYIRSDWGNNGPPVTAEMVKQVRDEIKDRKEQWTWAELQKMPPKDMAAPKASPPPGQPKPSGPQEQSAPPSPAPLSLRPRG